MNKSSLFFLMPTGILGALILIISGCQTNAGNNEKTSKPNKNDMEKLIIGTYTGDGPDEAEGMYLIARNTETGTLTFDRLLAPITNPTFQTLSPDGKYIYSVSEISDKGGSVCAYAIQPDNSLRKINEQPSLGRSACHVAVNQDQTMLFVTNYSSGVFTVYHLNEDGSVSEPVEHYEYKGSGPHPNQRSSHPHQTVISPDQKFLYVCDLGTDEIHCYGLDLKNKSLEALTPASHKLPPGSGPRHMTFHPELPIAYVINELGNTIQALKYNKKTGELTPIHLYSTLPDEFQGTSYCADIHVSPDGKYLYGSNRGHNSLVIFKVNPEDGKLDLIGWSSVYGEWPRNFFISQDGKFIYAANQKSGNISVLSRNEKTGMLSLVDSTFTDTFSPVCITQLE